ncbi:MAG: 7,8-dihydro-8-oxoguanine triphosphatase [Parcubacteria group bacterium Greene0714_21]|nr:MAG: 7,8-dihydro-8-oxoguanine triphosphatase [Parcubacteria group bacterium Greene1014_47]TSD04578.1 MAG: 7,8-dihydro-8-oxoguanine triphosphatase [Parcubacteria group bacterium Greene0714_21]
MKKILTLCIVHKGDKVLLGMKKRGFGQGKWNGFGGKLKEGEGLVEAMKREVREEAGISLKEFEEQGVLEFEFLGNSEILETHVFKALDFEGEPQETEEMKPCWFPIQEIPFDSMWPDDRYWYPLFLQGKRFKGRFLFKDQNTIQEYSLEQLP